MERFTPDRADKLTRQLRLAMPEWSFNLIIHSSKKATIEAAHRESVSAFTISEHLLKRSKKNHDAKDALRVKVKGHYGNLAKYIASGGRMTAPSLLITMDQLDNPEQAAEQITAFMPKLLSFFEPLIAERDKVARSSAGRQQLAQDINKASGGKIRTLHDGLYPDLYGNTNAWFLTGEVQNEDRVKMEITMPAELAKLIARTLGEHL